MASLTAPPPHIARQINEAVTLHRQGRLDEAEKLYNRVLKAQRDNFDALHLLGLIHLQRGKADQARRLIASALKINPRSPDALSSHATALHALKRDAEALAELDQALAIAPAHLDALNNRGTLLLDLNRPAEALAAFDRALAREPQHLQLLVNHGNALAAMNRFGDALADYDAALAQSPGHPHALYNKGNALRALNREAEAVACYDGAIQAIPDYVNAWYNRGLALQGLNRHAEALFTFEKVLSFDKNHGDAHFSIAAAHLTLGNYPAGFRAYEWRWKRTGMDAKPRFRTPPWLGEAPLAGRTILLHAEQGLGDTIQFVRYAPLLAQAGAKVLLEVQPELKDLMRTLDGVAAVFARGDTLPGFDLHCPLASLPLALKTELASVPANIPYLSADEVRIAKWRPRLDAVPGPRVALAWSGRASHPNDRNRSIPLAALAPLLATPGIAFVALQRDLRPADAAECARHASMLNLGEELNDFSDTAAVLALVDMVVSVDTSVAHIAAALGRPTAVLLPFQPDWRWTLGETSPWYPTAQLFRQPQPGDWGPVVARVAEELKSLRPSGA